MTAPCPTLGFVVTMQFAAEIPSATFDALLEDWIDVTEARGLTCDGGGTAEHARYLVYREGAQAEEADREAVIAWLATRSEIVESAVGPVHDLEDET